MTQEEENKLMANPATERTETSEDGQESDFVNLGGDQIERGIRRYTEDIQTDLRWYARYSLVARKLSFSDMGSELGVDATTVSRVLRGQYKVDGHLCKPPAKMLSRIRLMRQAEAERTRERQGRVMTPTVQEIWRVCRKSWSTACSA